MLLSLDISTAVVGMAIFDNDHKLQELSFLKFKKNEHNSLFIKLDEFIENFKKYSHINFTEIAIEAPLLKFKGKFSNAETIQKLTQINSLISGFLYKELNIEPTYYNVQTARKLAFPDIKVPKDHPNKKYIYWESVMKIETKINWIYSPRTHKLIDENFDMVDAYICGLAHIVSTIKQKSQNLKI